MNSTNNSVIMMMTNLIFTMVVNHIKKLIWTQQLFKLCGVVLSEWCSIIVYFYQCSIEFRVTNKNDKEKAEKLMKEKKNYAPTKFYEDISHDESCRDLNPGCMHLLKLSLMFCLSVACVECLFSKMKLVKTCLRNQLVETTLDSL